MTSSKRFKHVCGFYMKRMKFYTYLTILLYIHILKCDECLSFQLPYQLPNEILFNLHLELELNLLDQDVNEIEFELSRMLADETNLISDTCTIGKKILSPLKLFFFSKCVLTGKV